MPQPDSTQLLNLLLSERPRVGSPADAAANAAIAALIDQAQASGVLPREALAALLSRMLQIAVFEESVTSLSREVTRHLLPDPA